MAPAVPYWTEPGRFDVPSGRPEQGPQAGGFSEVTRDACGVGLLADLHGRPGRHLLPLALTALGRLGHRGAVDADGRTGDGAGVTTQIPYDVLRHDLASLGAGDRDGADLAVGLVFGPRAEERGARAR